MKTQNRLTSMFIQKVKKPGLYGDRNGLYLQVSKAITKSWLFRYRLNGKSRAMGLGSTSLVSLSEARILALEKRKLILENIDPIEQKREKKNEAALWQKSKATFDECARSYIAAHRPGWKNVKHASQWENTLKTYVSPIFGNIPVSQINTHLVLQVLTLIWHSKTETASRVRNRIELVLDWATVQGLREGENPARWRGRLDKLLPKKSSIQPVQHFKALPISQLAEFMKQLRSLSGISAKALEFLILTATRTNEVLGAKWEEINLNEQTWIIPIERMKAKKEHRVPLPKRAVEILINIKQQNPGNNFIFCNSHSDKPISNMAMLTLLSRMGYDITTHGFRSTFRDWVSEYTNHSREVAESALAHTLKNQSEAAYRRGDLLLKRRILMDDWEAFCSKQPLKFSKVTELKAMNV